MTVDSTVSPPPAPTPAPTPAAGAYGGVPASVPGTIEAEAFDEGGEGVGYEDSTAGNVMGVSGSGRFLCKLVRANYRKFRLHQLCATRVKSRDACRPVSKVYLVRED